MKIQFSFLPKPDLPKERDKKKLEFFQLWSDPPPPPPPSKIGTKKKFLKLFIMLIIVYLCEICWIKNFIIFPYISWKNLPPPHKREFFQNSISGWIRPLWMYLRTFVFFFKKNEKTAKLEIGLDAPAFWKNSNFFLNPSLSFNQA